MIDGEKLAEIQKILKNKANEGTRKSIIKFVPTAKKVYGVRLEVLNDILRGIKQPDFGLVEGLWEEGAFEERILATKTLGSIGKENPNEALRLVNRFSKDISDWVVCDTLATQGVRKIVKEKQNEIFKLAKRLISSKDFWQRRFAIVLLIELKRQGFSEEKIKKLFKKVRTYKENEEYVEKAVVWLKKELRK